MPAVEITKQVVNVNGTYARVENGQDIQITFSQSLCSSEEILRTWKNASTRVFVCVTLRLICENGDGMQNFADLFTDAYCSNIM